jgi:hypothetical protein
MRPLLAILLALAALPAAAQVTPPDSSLPLSQILTGIEADGTRTIYSVEFEVRRWEIVSCPGRSRFCLEEYVDPVTGVATNSSRETVTILPPRDGMPASQIAASFEAMNIGSITEMDFDDRRWEVELRNGIRRAEFRVDPITGAVLRCEGTLCP